MMAFTTSVGTVSNIAIQKVEAASVWGRWLGEEEKRTRDASSGGMSTPEEE